MKGIYKAAFLLPLVLATGCKDEGFDGPRLEKGDEVVFTFVGDVADTRTMYEDNWDYSNDKQSQKVFWGNYVQELGDDQVKVYCWNGARKVGTYEIKADDINNADQSAASKLTRLGDAGVQWGDANTTHQFFAFYPAKAAGNEMLSATTIRANVDPGQSPVSWRAVMNGKEVTDQNNILEWAQSNAQRGDQFVTTLYGNPDMDAALMVAKTTVDAAGYGRPVGLNFKVVADVLDLTINGPVVPNTLGGNAAGGGERNYIRIQSVTVEHKNSNQAIAGDFDFNMSTNESSNFSGSNTIQMQFPAANLPQLNVRVSKTSGVTAADIDHLRLRAFLIPGAVKNLNELQVRISTDCGEYIQPLNTQSMVRGEIHRVSLKYFNQRGQDFDFSNWMAQLDPNIYITELSIPGTWHSTDPNYHATTDLVSQYGAGIRAFETHAKVTAAAPEIEYSGGTPTYNNNTTRSNGDLQSDHTADPTASGQTREVYRTVTYTRTYSGNVTGVVRNAAFNVVNSAGANLLNGIKNLGNAIKSGEFAFLEIGDPNSSDISVPAKGATVNGTKTITKIITKTQTGTQTSRGFIIYSWGNPSWNSITDPTDAEWDAAPIEKSEMTNVTYSKVVSGNSFVLGIDWLLQELKAQGSNIYTAGITPTTKIADVLGHYIIKVNTNNNSNESGWTANAPALFSRWQDNAENNIGNIALQWGAPIAPDGASTLRWIYSEKDNVRSTPNRKTAVEAYISGSYNAYSQGDLGYWFELSVGGYIGGEGTYASLERCQNLAKVMNPYLLDELTAPTRKACPMGLVYFNTYSGDEYKVTDLIRTIINNNAAFTLRKARAKNASDKTNSSFKQNPGNPLKVRRR